MDADGKGWPWRDAHGNVISNGYVIFMLTIILYMLYNVYISVL